MGQQTPHPSRITALHREPGELHWRQAATRWQTGAHSLTPAERQLSPGSASHIHFCGMFLPDKYSLFLACPFVSLPYRPPAICPYKTAVVLEACFVHNQLNV